MNKQKDFFDTKKDDELINIYENSTNLSDLFKKLGYAQKPSNSKIADVKMKFLKMGIDINTLIKAKPIDNKTKGELFNERLNWQSARSSIAKHARKIFKKSSKNKECIICGYNKFYDVSHIKPVSSFGDEILIKEINVITNLIALCGNHHYEYDNDLMSIEDLNKIILRGGEAASHLSHKHGVPYKVNEGSSPSPATK